MTTLSRRACVLGVAASLITRPTFAQSPQMRDHEYIFALDVSNSAMTQTTMVEEINVHHWLLQLTGHVKALRNPDIIRSLVMHRPVLRAIFWAESAVELFSPVPVDSAADIELFVTKLLTYHPSYGTPLGNGTHHYRAIQFAHSLERMGIIRILDIISDGVVFSSSQYACRRARDTFAQANGRINALAIGADDAIQKSLTAHIVTENGFCHQIDDWSDCEEAIPEKIRLETGV